MNVLGLLLVLAYLALAVIFVWAAITVIRVGRRWLKLHPEPAIPVAVRASNLDQQR